MRMSVGGVMVSIDAFQALDPGSIPGHRSPFIVTIRIVMAIAMLKTPSILY